MGNPLYEAIVAGDPIASRKQLYETDRKRLPYNDLLKFWHVKVGREFPIITAAKLGRYDVCEYIIDYSRYIDISTHQYTRIDMLGDLTTYMAVNDDTNIMMLITGGNFFRNVTEPVFDNKAIRCLDAILSRDVKSVTSFGRYIDFQIKLNDTKFLKKLAELCRTHKQVLHPLDVARIIMLDPNYFDYWTNLHKLDAEAMCKFIDLGQYEFAKRLSATVTFGEFASALKYVFGTDPKFISAAIDFYGMNDDIFYLSIETLSADCVLSTKYDGKIDAVRAISAIDGACKKLYYFNNPDPRPVLAVLKQLDPSIDWEQAKKTAGTILKLELELDY